MFYYLHYVTLSFCQFQVKNILIAYEVMSVLWDTFEYPGSALMQNLDLCENGIPYTCSDCEATIALVDKGYFKI